MVTMKDVAKRAGVTERTVYNVIHKSNKVSPKTIDKVNIAIKELNYRESFVARSLVTGKTRSLGLIIPEARSSFFYNMFIEIEAYARENDYNVFVCLSGNTAKQTKYYIDMLYKRGVDGIILDYTDELYFLKDYGVPVVSFNSFSNNNPFYNCISNFEKSIKDIIDKMYNLNCRSFVFLYDDYEINAKARLNPYINTLNEYGIEPKYYNMRNHNKEVFELLCKNTLDGLLSDNDFFISEFILYCMNKGLNIKDKINLVGYDNFHISSFFNFDTIQQDTKSMAKSLVDKLVSEIENKEVDNVKNIFDCIHIDRGTCKKIINI